MQSLIKSFQNACRVSRSHLLYQNPVTEAGPMRIQIVHMSFYNNTEASSLWAAMTGVSQQGKKRGRARNLMRPKNLNRGQVIGIGKRRVDFPGLTSKAYTGTGKEMRKKPISEVSETFYSAYEEKVEESRATTGQKRMRRKVGALERGWSGGKPLGKKFGAPESANKDYRFNNFESILLEFKTVFHMTGNLGRVRRTSCLMVTGNGNGTFGYSLTPGKYGNNFKTFRSATNKAGLRLITIDRYEDRTVFHDFFSQFGNTRVQVRQQPPGSGIKAQRGIKAICEMAGITDIHVSLSGSKNMQNVVKAFMLGLLRQKTHQTLADEKGLHLVEMRPENDFYPRVLASPSDGKIRTQSEIGHNEILDFEMICFEGNLPEPRMEKRNPYEGTPGWDVHLRRSWAWQHHPYVRQRMRVENGEQFGAVRSHLYDKYPECVERDFTKPKRSREAED